MGVISPGEWGLCILEPLPKSKPDAPQRLSVQRSPTPDPGPGDAVWASGRAFSNVVGGSLRVPLLQIFGEKCQ